MHMTQTCAEVFCQPLVAEVLKAMKEQKTSEVEKLSTVSPRKDGESAQPAEVPFANGRTKTSERARRRLRFLLPLKKRALE
jgi:hypothetical protein